MLLEEGNHNRGSRLWQFSMYQVILNWEENSKIKEKRRFSLFSSSLRRRNMQLPNHKSKNLYDRQHPDCKNEKNCMTRKNKKLVQQHPDCKMRNCMKASELKK
jgi:hypothetical protein